MIFRGLKSSHTNRDKETGKWAWNPFKGGTFVVTLSGSPSGGWGSFDASFSYNGAPIYSTAYHNQYDPGANAMIAINNMRARESFFEGNNQQWNSHVDAEVRNRVMNAGQGGMGWEPIVGTAGSIAQEMYFSEKYGTWMGKNFKIYQQTWGGNGYTGGKNKYAKKTSNAIKWGGRALGVYSGFNTIEQRVNGEIKTGWMLAELGTTGVSAYGTLYGAAWGFGWEIGRAVTSMDWYKEAKFNFWYNRWESKIGAPSQSNEILWYYFYKNYKP